jgi:tRNA A-37 threonylcarbamoyl transferase component Bud32
MAELFLARRRAPGGVEKRVVIKRIRRERAGDARFAALFVREARLSMSLSHKNIVPVFDFGRAGDELFLVMEYVEGVDLASALARVRERGLRVDPVLVAYIGLEACQALEYAHQVSGLDGQPQGVIHRDVTPANVLLSYSGEVKLLDFGIATSDAAVREAAPAREQKVRGTPPYMAPEQARGEAVSAATDVFAVGLVLWEALAGRRAYDARDVRKVLAAARRGKVPRLEPDRAPAALTGILERATRPDRESRYPDARAMQLALDEYLIDARSGLERRGPIHQLLATWVRELFPDREGGAGVPTTIALPDGPVATFLDDGEQQIANMPAPGELGTEGSIAETVADGAEDPAAAEAEVETVAARPARSRDASPEPTPARREAVTRRRRRPSPWTLAAAALAVGAVAVLVVARDLALRMPARAAAEQPIAVDGARRARGAGQPGAGAASPPTGAREEGPPRPERRPETDDAFEEKPRAAMNPPSAVEAAGPPRPGAEAEPAPRAHAARGEPARRARGPTGTVRVSSSPWAEVRVVGRPERCPETPCSMTLPAGSHTLTLRNPVAQVGKTVRVVVRTDATVTVRETLTPGR